MKAQLIMCVSVCIYTSSRFSCEEAYNVILGGGKYAVNESAMIMVML